MLKFYLPIPQNVIFGNSDIAYVIKLRYSHTRVGWIPNPIWPMSIYKKGNLDTEIHRGKTGGREGEKTAMGFGEAEEGVMHW